MPIGTTRLATGRSPPNQCATAAICWVAKPAYFQITSTVTSSAMTAIRIRRRRTPWTSHGLGSSSGPVRKLTTMQPSSRNRNGPAPMV